MLFALLLEVVSLTVFIDLWLANNKKFHATEFAAQSFHWPKNCINLPTSIEIRPELRATYKTLFFDGKKFNSLRRATGGNCSG